MNGAHFLDDDGSPDECLPLDLDTWWSSARAMNDVRAVDCNGTVVHWGVVTPNHWALESTWLLTLYADGETAHQLLEQQRLGFAPMDLW